MKKQLKLSADIALCAIAATSLVSCGECASSGAKGEKSWEYEVVEHKNFKDLGNYVIELPDYTDASVEQKGLAATNSKFDKLRLEGGGCTAMVKRNSKGEVIFGRNMDLDISQSPGFVFRTTFGKYKNFSVAYLPHAYPTYAEIQKMDELDEALLNMIPYIATDCLNEKGFYIEVDLRERDDKLLNFGLHSTHGETTRSDGKPWSELRAYNMSIPQLVSQNCATVKEAVEFLKNSYDWYTMAPYGNGYTMINMAFLVGDATGEYGLIEIAQDEVNYIPYQFGHANYYITPKWSALQTWGPGYGRLDMVSKVIGAPETLEEMMDAMKPIMWRNETLWLGESQRVADKQHQHPYSQVVFQDNQGNPTLDWRSEYVFQCPVLDDGRMLLPAQIYEYAKKSTVYDPKIKEYFDEAIKRGQLVVDDGSFKFTVMGRKLTLDQLTKKYNEYNQLTDDALLAEQQPYEDEYRRLILNMDNYWLHNDDHFEAAKAFAYAQIHTRYNDKGEFDLNSMSKYDKLCAFYGMGVEKDETPLRDDGTIWTTSLNIGVNCARKEMKIRFWEDDNVIYHVKF
ncbi:MAG: linear amide C-N hydrolase [Bacteroidales bacterium]|nr:linear amide C-N hydrolase [Bacteroidales bacterium]